MAKEPERADKLSTQSHGSDAAAPKGVARNDEGRAELVKKKEAAKAARDAKHGDRQAKLEDYLRRWREQSSTHRCADAEATVTLHVNDVHLYADLY